jgi:DNA-binding MarR family transcriptional regulator
LSDGNLSAHLSKLEEAGLVNIQKQFVARKPSTQLKITRKGLAAIQGHWDRLAAIKQGAEAWERSSRGKQHPTKWSSS